jgi:hypothetical protein
MHPRVPVGELGGMVIELQAGHLGQKGRAMRRGLSVVGVSSPRLVADGRARWGWAAVCAACAVLHVWRRPAQA